MSKLITLTDKIVSRADEELKERIKEASKPLDTLLRNGSSYSVSGPSEYNDDSPAFKALWYRALQALQAAAFNLHCEQNRQSAVDAFERRLAEVESKIENFHDDYLP